MSQNIRAESAPPADDAGRIWNVAGSGRASMSLSLARAKPSIADPSKPMPSSKAPSSSAGAIATDFKRAEDIGEPEPHETDLALLERAQHEFLLAIHNAPL